MGFDVKYDRRRRAGIVVTAGGFIPLDIDFTALSDGTLPSVFTGGTWAIVSGKAVNTPTLQGELLANPGLEGSYTAGLAPSLSKTGSPTVSEDTSTPHGGSSAQQFIAAANGNLLQFTSPAGVADTWYQVSEYAKRTAGATTTTCMGVFQTGMLPETANSPFAEIVSATYILLKFAFYSTSTNTIFTRPVQEATTPGGQTVIVDDVSLQKITRSSLYTLTNSGAKDGIWKVKPDTFTDNSLCGVVIRADSGTDPTNCIYAVIQRQPRASTSVLIYLMKKVGSTTSLVMSVQTAAIVADAWFEVRASGTTISVWYNGVQKGTNQTVSDAKLNTNDNKYAGIWSTGDNGFKGFFASAS